MMSSTFSFSTSLRIAAGTFVLHVLTHAYHICVEPLRLYVAYSPDPLFLTVFLFTLVIFHTMWLSNLWHRDPTAKPHRWPTLRASDAAKSKPRFCRAQSFDYEALRSRAEREVAQEEDLTDKIKQVQEEYLPIYTLGNVCLGGWSIAWVHRQYTLCQVLCIVTVIAQLYTLFFIFGSRRFRDFYQRDYLTNLIVKPRIAAAIMLMFKTWGADKNLPSPSISIQLCFATLLIILTLASGPEPTLGLCLVYALVSLEFGCRYTDSGWHSTFMWLATLVAIVTMCDWISTLSRRDIAKAGSISKTVLSLCMSKVTEV